MTKFMHIAILLIISAVILLAIYSKSRKDKQDPEKQKAALNLAKNHGNVIKATLVKTRIHKQKFPKQKDFKQYTATYQFIYEGSKYTKRIRTNTLQDKLNFYFLTDPVYAGPEGEMNVFEFPFGSAIAMVCVAALTLYAIL